MDDVQQTLNFTDADLKANRAGQLSSAQRAKLHSKKRTTHLLFVLFLITFVTSILAERLTADVIASGAVAINPLFFTFFAVLFGLGLGYSVLRTFSVRRDLRVGRVVGATGAIKLHMEGKRAKFGTVSIGKRVFAINRQTYNALEAGAVYILYYALHSEVLLSAEKLEDAKTTWREAA